MPKRKDGEPNLSQFSELKNLQKLVDQFDNDGWNLDKLKQALIAEKQVLNEAQEHFGKDYDYNLWEALALKISFAMPSLKDEIIADLGGQTAADVNELFGSYEGALSELRNSVTQTLAKYELDQHKAVWTSSNRVEIHREKPGENFWGQVMILEEDGSLQANYVYQDGESTNMIPVSVGFINHEYTHADTVYPKKLSELVKSFDAETFYHFLTECQISENEFHFMLNHIDGKLATDADFMSRLAQCYARGNYYRPLRIGYRIYEEGALVTLNKIRTSRPDLWE